MKHTIYMLFVIMGCATGTANEEDAGTDANPCAINQNYDIDFENCGECGHICVSDVSDECIDGVCVCSGSDPNEDGLMDPCHGKEECKLGGCVLPELSAEKGGYPEATPCEWDHQCNDPRMCVGGVCTVIPCNDEARIAMCYTGLLGTENNDPCHDGYRICWGGSWGECREEVTPIDENGILNCDGIDNDCDGCPDGNWVGEICVPTKVRDFDVLFIFDVSGSMSGVCDAVVEAMRMLGSSFDGNEHFHFGINEIPAPGTGCEPGISHDFSTYADFQSALDVLECGNGGSEPNWDAPYMAAENLPMYDIAASAVAGEKVYSTMSWREEATHVIIEFTDENGQSYTVHDNGLCTLDGPIDESVMCSVFDTEILAVVTKDKWLLDFDECSEPYRLVNDADVMVDSLREILESACAD